MIWIRHLAHGTNGLHASPHEVQKLDIPWVNNSVQTYRTSISLSFTKSQWFSFSTRKNEIKVSFPSCATIFQQVLYITLSGIF